jgi:hypothetical protein
MDEGTAVLEPDISKLTGIRRPGFGGADFPKKVQRYDPCAYCARLPLPEYGHYIDHIQARSQGGPNHWSNYTAACGFCNQAKFDTPLLEFLTSLNFDMPEAIADELGVSVALVRETMFQAVTL